MKKYTITWRENFGGGRLQAVDIYGLSEQAIGGMARGLSKTDGIEDVVVEVEDSTTRRVFP